MHQPPVVYRSPEAVALYWTSKYQECFSEEIYRKVPIRTRTATCLFLLSPDRHYYAYYPGDPSTLTPLQHYGEASSIARTFLESFDPIYHVTTPTRHEHLCDREFLVDAFLPLGLPEDDFFSQPTCGPLGLGRYSSISLNTAIDLAIVKRVY
jgi:hypothetical protein